ncbi:hypothetical protein [Bacillus wiedmannii]|uniref:Uncharacterized protein n=1 Tax=Bacillus wiedmannii TaxID=1890302 RepID=A0ABX5DMA9_9BACI|nr:hypothetical protein [Bacillus wiedmannii]PRT35477.1 hypothetical protein C6357_28825 [Bacillus wiedmannii]
MSEYNTNETVTMSLERYQDLMAQMEYLENKSIDNFIKVNKKEVQQQFATFHVCESIEINLERIENDLLQRHQDCMTIPKTEVTFKYKGGSLTEEKELLNGLQEKKTKEENASKTKDKE